MYYHMKDLMIYIIINIYRICVEYSIEKSIFLNWIAYVYTIINILYWYWLNITLYYNNTRIASNILWRKNLTNTPTSFNGFYFSTEIIHKSNI